jgi:hypothetical protein
VDSRTAGCAAGLRRSFLTYSSLSMSVVVGSQLHVHSWSWAKRVSVGLVICTLRESSANIFQLSPSDFRNCSQTSLCLPLPAYPSVLSLVCWRALIPRVFPLVLAGPSSRSRVLFCSLRPARTSKVEYVPGTLARSTAAGIFHQLSDHSNGPENKRA